MAYRCCSIIIGLLLISPTMSAATIACITTPGTYDATLGSSWVGGTAPNSAGGDSITCATSGVKEIFTANYILGNSPIAGTKIVNFTSGSTFGIAQNVKLTALGDVAVSVMQRAAGGWLFFDSSASTNPTANGYQLTANSFTDDPTHPPTWTTGNSFLISSNVSTGTPAHWLASTTAGAGISGFTSTTLADFGDPATPTFTGNTVSGTNTILLASTILGLYPGQPITGTGIATTSTTTILSATGTTVTLSSNATATATGTAFKAGPTPGLTYISGGSGTLALGGTGTPVIFLRTCGIVEGIAWVVGDQVNLKQVSLENTDTGCNGYTGNSGNASPTGTRIFDTVVSDAPFVIDLDGTTITNSILLKAFTAPLPFGINYGLITNSLIVQNWQAGTLTWNANNGLPINDWTLTNDLILGDPTTTIVAGVPTAQTSLISGTATSATTGTLSSTLTDTSKSMTTNAFSSALNSVFSMAITGGTGKGQFRPIVSNTATVFTLIQKWNVQPDATSTYAVYKGPGNNHWTNGASIPSTTTEPPYTGNVGQLVTDTDNNGDFWHAVNSVGGTTCATWLGTWSSATAYIINEGVVQSGIYYRSLSSTTNNDPSTDGGVHWIVVSTLAGLNSGCGTHEFKNNTIACSVGFGDNSGTLITGGNAFYKLSHNTYCTGSQSAAFGESRPSPFPHAVKIFQSNLAFSSDLTRTWVGISTNVASGLGPFVIADTGAGGTSGPPGSIYLDLADNSCSFSGAISCADFNGSQGMLTTGYCASVTGSNQGGSTAYNNVCTEPYGSHDIVANPLFVDQFASPQKWIASLGYCPSNSNDPVACMPEVYKCMMKVNDITGFDSRCTITALYSYYQLSFSTQQPLFNNAGSDGITIGAGPYLPKASGGFFILSPP